MRFLGEVSPLSSFYTAACSHHPNQCDTEYMNYRSHPTVVRTPGLPSHDEKSQCFCHGCNTLHVLSLRDLSGLTSKESPPLPSSLCSGHSGIYDGLSGLTASPASEPSHILFPLPEMLFLNILMTHSLTSFGSLLKCFVIIELFLKFLWISNLTPSPLSEPPCAAVFLTALLHTYTITPVC